MQKLTPWTQAPEETGFRGRQRITYGGALTAANARALAELEAQAGSAGRLPDDPPGRHLRMLRLQQQVDPVTLASRACISLRQLYQLETGETSLFYSQAMRNQAGRRVARLLGAQWDALGQTGPSAITDKPLKLVPPHTPTPASAQVQVADAATEPEVQPHMGLVRAASETLTVAAPDTALITAPRPQTDANNAPSGRSAFWAWTLVGWVLAGGAGFGIGWALGTYTELAVLLPAWLNLHLQF